MTKQVALTRQEVLALFMCPSETWQAFEWRERPASMPTEDELTRLDRALASALSPQAEFTLELDDDLVGPALAMIPIVIESLGDDPVGMDARMETNVAELEAIQAKLVAALRD